MAYDESRSWEDLPNPGMASRPWKGLGAKKEIRCDFCLGITCAQNDYMWIGDFKIYVCDDWGCARKGDKLFNEYPGKVGLPDHLLIHSVGTPRMEVLWPEKAPLIGAARVLDQGTRYRINRKIS